MSFCNLFAIYNGVSRSHLPHTISVGTRICFAKSDKSCPITFIKVPFMFSGRFFQSLEPCRASRSLLYKPILAHFLQKRNQITLITLFILNFGLMPALSTRTNFSTNFEYRAAYTIATLPPNECPTKTTFSVTPSDCNFLCSQDA